jgi:integrase
VKLMNASGPKHRAMWAVGVGEGLRPSELERLQWHHVRWDDRTLDVPGEKTAASADTVPLTPIAWRELHAWWTRQGEPTEGYCFPASSAGRPYRGISGYKRALSTAAETAGLGRPITPYLLRHSFATLAWSLGIDKEVARRIGRWTDMAMLDRVYTRPRPADLVSKVAAFDVPTQE